MKRTKPFWKTWNFLMNLEEVEEEEKWEMAEAMETTFLDDERV